MSGAIEIYLSSLEEKLIKVEVPIDKFSNLPISELRTLYDLKDDENIEIKSDDKSARVVL